MDESDGAMHLVGWRALGKCRDRSRDVGGGRPSGRKDRNSEWCVCTGWEALAGCSPFLSFEG